MQNSNKSIEKNESKIVAIVVPLSDRERLTDEEKVSMRHLVHFLGHYDKYLVVPKALEANLDGFRIKRFENKYFGSAVAHNKMLLSRQFYETFSDYEFILIYHLDSLVFSDQLLAWCELNFDYIGAPWIRHPEAPYTGDDQYEGRVGNGGFSLRKVRSFLKVLNSSNLYMEASEYWDKHYKNSSVYVRIKNSPKKFLMHLPFINNIKYELSRYQKNEEHFWAHRARHYYPEFNIADVEIALRFSFESVPQYCFEKNGCNLPFGCHAWPKYDRDFWEPYIIKQS